MPKLTHKLKKFGGRRIAFSLVVLTYLGFLGYINVMMLLPGSGIAAMGHFSFFSTGETHDLIHELVFTLIIGTAAIGLLSQLWRPKENFAGQLIALIAWVAVFLIAAITNNWIPGQLFIIFGGLTLLATILHPAGRGLFNWFTPLEVRRQRRLPTRPVRDISNGVNERIGLLTGFSASQVNKVLLALVIIAAVPLLVFVSINFNLQVSGGGAGGTGFSGLFGHQKSTHGGDSAINQELSRDQMLNETEDMATDDEADHDKKHVTLGHYRNLVALSFIVILVGLLASFRLKGWRLAAWTVGFLPILLGLASIVLPDAESSLGVPWGIAAIAWGIVFVAVAEFARRKELKEVQEL